MYENHISWNYGLWNGYESYFRSNEHYQGSSEIIYIWVLSYKTEILTMVDKHVDVLILDAYFLFQVLKTEVLYLTIDFFMK